MMPFNTILYDRRFVSLLLSKIVGREDLAVNNIGGKKLQFIRGMQYNETILSIFYFNVSTQFIISDTFVIRVGNDASRAIRFADYVDKKKQKEKQKNNM